jgi:tetratricopeptide (TPR) repeat protein
MSVEHAFDAAVMMMRAGRRQEAARVAWEILRQNPRHADAWAMRAMVEAQEGRYENAMLHHGFAVQFAPDRVDLWVNRGVDAMAARMFKESEESFKKSLALNPTYEGHYNYGNLLSAMMRVGDAVDQFEAALSIDDKTNPQIHANLGVALIAEGRWKEGFQRYRHRFNAPGFPPRPRFNYPQWRSEPLDGKTIMLYVEQGFGDEIMSLRFAHAVQETGARVILAVRPPMLRLARSFVNGEDLILMYDQPPVEPDYMCALLDVPAFLNIDPTTIPYQGGYLAAEDRGFRLQMPEGLNVGICWSSGKRDLQPTVVETAKQKSLAFEQLAAPLARRGVNLFSLQQTHNDDLRAFGVRDVMAGVTDFADTAFIIDHLDLVVTVDTSVAHLAGAMGKPVWNLVRHDAMWPWMQEYRSTCWYESMRLYRQEKPFDWTAPLTRMASDFAGLADRAMVDIASRRCVAAREALSQSPAA